MKNQTCFGDPSVAQLDYCSNFPAPSSLWWLYPRCARRQTWLDDRGVYSSRKKDPSEVHLRARIKQRQVKVISASTWLQSPSNSCGSAVFHQKPEKRRSAGKTVKPNLHWTVENNSIHRKLLNSSSKKIVCKLCLLAKNEKSKQRRSLCWLKFRLSWPPLIAWFDLLDGNVIVTSSSGSYY